MHRLIRAPDARSRQGTDSEDSTMQNGNRRLAAVVGVATAAAALPAPATGFAKAPPRGLYQCYQYDYSSGYLYSGGFRLKRHHRYTAVSGGKGKYRVKGRKVIFKSGPYHDFKGKTRRDKGNWVIDLTLKSDPSVKENCSHAKK